MQFEVWTLPGSLKVNLNRRPTVNFIADRSTGCNFIS
jgi:hypothetical protein